MSRIEFLSYPLKPVNPVYGEQSKKLNLKPVKSIATGDSCNVFRLELENHWGTHVDCPAHFFNDSLTAANYPAGFWCFQKPQIISIKVEPCQIIRWTDLKDNIYPQTDFLIVYTGWGEKREQNDYCLRNPGISPEVGRYLRKDFPSIRAIGFDFISISSFNNRELGQKSHRMFLDPDGENASIVIVEDMNLTGDLLGLSSVWVVPIRVEGMDSAPCTVIGIFDSL